MSTVDIATLVAVSVTLLVELYKFPLMVKACGNALTVAVEALAVLADAADDGAVADGVAETFVLADTDALISGR